MPEQTIVIDIDEEGKVSAKTSGFTGDICIEKLQEIIGKDQLFSELKPSDSFHIKTSSNVINKISAGRK